MRIKLVLWFMLTQIMVGHQAIAQDSALQVKAAFLYKFCGYTTWPENRFLSEHAPIVVGVAGHQRVVDEIGRVFAGKTIGGRPLSVHKINAESDLSLFHLLYVNQGSRLDLARFSLLQQNAPILTITEKHALPEYAVINFILYDDYIRFEISRTRAKEVGLELSSQLLSVALTVQ